MSSLAPEPAIRIPAQIREAMLRHAEMCRPHEACGLVAIDREGALVMAYPLTNAEASAARFTIASEEHFGALRHAEAMGWAIGGVFHSHPSGSAVLSPVDLAQPHDPDWFHLVVGFRPRREVRAWRIQGGTAVELGTT